jgi:hypothetical protein
MEFVHVILDAGQSQDLQGESESWRSEALLV